MERAWAELKMGASGEPVFGFAASSTLPFIAHGGLVEQASVATIRKAAMQQYPALMVTNSQGDTNAAFSRADRIKLFQWVNDHLGWISHYDTIYVFVDNRSLAGPDAPDYWPLLAPWIRSRCAVVGPYLEKTTAIHFPISAATGLQGVH